MQKGQAMQLYFARPIFTPGERDYNAKIESMIDELGIQRPQWGAPPENDTRSRAKRIFDGCFGGIAPSNAVLAILNGTEVDDGTAAEIGVFYAMMETDSSKKGIVGLLDDWRTDAESEHMQGKGLNDFLLGCICSQGSVVHTPDEAMEQLKVWKAELEAASLGKQHAQASLPREGSTAAERLGCESAEFKVYFAAPQFTPYARRFVAEHAQILRDHGLEVYVPRERARLEPPLLTPEEVFARDYAELKSSDALVALLDGTQPDDGVALELGLFYGLLRDDPSKKGILGFMTDSRGLRRREHGYGCNHFPVGVILECGSVTEDFAAIVAQLKSWSVELGGELR
jgi:nucleoside 2-deoxyribosyltransferase